MYPHLYVRADVPNRMGQPFACRCGHYGFAEGERGSRCRAAMEERIADLEHTANAAHDQLADIAALARGEMEPDKRSGGAPVLGEAWEAVKALRVRAELAEARCDALEERMTTADVPWRVHGCQCPADSKPGDRCDHRWSRCNGRLQWLKARKVTGEGR